MKDLTALLNDEGTSVAVVGATDDPAKYGSVIYRDLKRKGFRVYPVNRTRSHVDGDVAYPRLADVPETPTVVNIVVPPDQTIEVVREAHDLGLHNIWVQPGAESPSVLRFLQEKGLNYVANSCIMVRSRLAAHR
ncbi:MAG: CoA-binding protein [Acidimicrobiia bacterium]